VCSSGRELTGRPVAKSQHSLVPITRRLYHAGYTLGSSTAWNLYCRPAMSGAYYLRVCRAMSSARSQFRTIALNPAPVATQETNDAVLEAAGPVGGARVLVMGHDTPGIVAALACCGAAEITLLGPNARPEAATTDIAVATGVGYAQRAVETACRALSRSGRIVLRSAAEADDDLADGIARTLREAGFARLRLRTAGGRIIASGSLPRLNRCRST
jgi:hypothetical protein